MKLLLVSVGMVMVALQGVPVHVVNVKNELAPINRYWDLKTVGLFNEHKVQVAKLKGPFKWHHHEKEDELFFVLKGHLILHFRDGDVHVRDGEFVIVPHLVEHNPEAVEEVEVLLIKLQ